MRLAVFAWSPAGLKMAERVRAALCTEGDSCRLYAPRRYAGGDFAPVTGPCADFTGPVFQWADALVFVGAAGIALRCTAPHIRDKRSDPAVLAADETGRFVIPLLSGHIGGANALAERLAAALGALPVITTASDLRGKFSVDSWAARQGLRIPELRPARAVAAALLAGETVGFVSCLPVRGALPEGLCPGERGRLGICVSWEDRRPFEETLLLVPPVLHLGLGCRRGTTAAQLGAVVDALLRERHIHPAAVKCAASIDLKREEAGLLELCRDRGWPLSFYPAEALRALPGDFTASDFVREVTGVDNVCERAALMDSGGGRLIVGKTAAPGVTAALAAEDREVCFE